MISSRRLTALAEAQSALLALLAPVAPRHVACAEAVGLVAADLAPLPAGSPARAVALRAGYALRSHDLAGASSFSPALLAERPTLVGMGDVLPDGCDCVLEEAALDLCGPMTQAFVESYPGENIRRAGEDFAAGAIVIAAGRRISPLDALVASRVGLDSLPVRRPRVAILGDAGEFLTRQAQLAGAEIVLSDSSSADLVIIAGRAPPSLAWRIQGVAVEPGRDCGFGLLGAVPAIALPPAPDQMAAGWMTLVRPALDRLAARQRPAPLALPLSAKISSRVGIAELALLKEIAGMFAPLAVGDCPLQFFTLATHAALIAAGSEGHAAGETIAADPLDA